MHHVTDRNRNLWHFLALTQPLFLRYLHGIIAVLVLSQIITSIGIFFTPSDGLYGTFTLMHISTGLLLLVLSFVLVIYCFKYRGLQHYYPYIWGDFSQIRQDIRILLARELPEASPRGLATSVQGLGLGALVLVVLSGFFWFMLWVIDSSFAPVVREWHKGLTGLIEVYLVGHGVMGLLHFSCWYLKQRNV